MKRVFEAIPNTENNVTKFLSNLRKSYVGTFFTIVLGFGFSIDIAFRAVGLAKGLNVGSFQCQEKTDKSMPGLIDAFCQDRYAPIDHSWIIDISIMCFCCIVLPIAAFLPWWSTNNNTTSILHEHRSGKNKRRKNSDDESSSEKSNDNQNQQTGGYLDAVSYLIRIIMVVINLSIRVLALWNMSELTLHQSTYNEASNFNLVIGSQLAFSEQWTCSKHGEVNWLLNKPNMNEPEIDAKQHESHLQDFEEAAKLAMNRNNGDNAYESKGGISPWLFSSPFSRFYVRHVEVVDPEKMSPGENGEIKINPLATTLPFGFFSIPYNRQQSQNNNNYYKVHAPYSQIGLYKTNFSNLPKNSMLVSMEIPLHGQVNTHCYTTNAFERTFNLWFYYLYTTISIILNIVALCHEISLFVRRIISKMYTKAKRDDQTNVPDFERIKIRSTTPRSTCDRNNYEQIVYDCNNNATGSPTIHPSYVNVAHMGGLRNASAVSSGSFGRDKRVM